ncbi:uncharacterized protein B0T15DRAFT_196890 [Chaetomium strumarium]|uniref:Uncharacterized protein n=1 Tax=Chaetomium strumarium TaxID=1170767 RepID=A0AAJ0GSN0_9PEZI|nr:hypothetical protein B0T15DRAFT_196890 [Chaetomium strumarium]
MFTSVSVRFLFLSCLGRTGAVALLGWQQPHHDATEEAIHKRDMGIQVISTRLSTIYASGDPFASRTADFGGDFRIDGANHVWGFCATTNIAVEQCSLVGRCFDSHDCTSGCGSTAPFSDGTFTGAPLGTITCRDAKFPACSTAILSPQPFAQQVTWLACGEGAVTEVYFGFTTAVALDLESSTSAETSRPTGSSPTASGRIQSTSPESRTNVPSATESRSDGSVSTTPTDPNTGDGTTKNDSSNNMGAIIGAAIGGLALLCGFSIAVVWILRRSRNAKPRPSSRSDPSSSVISAPLNLKPELDAVWSGRSELFARGPAAYDTASPRLRYPPMTPVELPTTPGVR